MIITIARQCGCGGHEVARILANKLGMELFDKKKLLEDLFLDISFLQAIAFLLVLSLQHQSYNQRQYTEHGKDSHRQSIIISLYTVHNLTFTE